MTLTGSRANIAVITNSSGTPVTTVTIPAGATSAPLYGVIYGFTVTHGVRITATLAGVSRSADFLITPQQQANFRRREALRCASLSLAPCLSALSMTEVTSTFAPTTLAVGDTSGYYLYTPDLKLLAETQVSSSAAKPIAYSYLWFGDVPVASVEASTNTTRWYATDHLATPLVMTDSAGAPVWRAEYAPFGSTFTIRAGSGIHQPLRFPGQIALDGNEASYNVFRWYRSGWGRYTQADPIGSLDLAAVATSSLSSVLTRNTFGYASANPVARIDRRGLYDCFYSISAHTMTCNPTEDEAHPQFHGSDYVSGNDKSARCPDCQNNPDRTGVSRHGPIPTGRYTITAQKPNSARRPLIPDPSFVGPRVGGNRTDFQIHGCGNPAKCSEGCIAATTNADRDLLNEILSLEEGYNTLLVLP